MNTVPNMKRDVELLTAMALGDTAAFAEFYDRNSSNVFGLLIRMVRERADAEDILQEAFLQVWKQAGRYDEQRSSPYGWLCTIARSRALDFLRRRVVANQSELPESAVFSEAELQLERDEAAGRARIAMNELPIEQRSAIELAFFSGLTYEQVAAAQRIPVGTAKTRIRLGLQKLRGSLTEREGLGN